MRRWTTASVVALCAAVAAVVSLATTLVVLRVTGDDALPPPAVGVPAGVADGVAVPGGGTGLDLPALFGQVSDGVVRIETTACVLGGAGTGFLVAPDLVVTAAHVVEGAHAILLRRDDGTEAEARVVGLDSVHDVALVRASKKLDGHLFRFAVAEPAVGADVAALGYPLDGPLVPVRRTVTGTGQSLDVSTAASAGPDQVVRDLLRVDGGFEGGDSGGPLLAADGSVVGFVEGRSLADKNTGYAVSALQVAPLVARWRRLTTTVDVADTCDTPVGPPQSRVVVRDASGPGPGAVVADFYGAYASAINSGRYGEAWAMLTTNARAGQTLEQWSEAERSSQIFDVAVRQVAVVAPGTDPTTAPASPPATAASASPSRTPGGTTTPTGPAAPVVTPGEGGSLRAVVDFSSTQEDRLGPAGQTCSRWRVTYMLLRADGVWRIDRTLLAPGYPQPC